MKRRTFLQRSTGMMASLAATKLVAQSKRGIQAMPDYSSTGVELIRGSTPKADGYYFPAEWEPHAGTITVMPPPGQT